MKIKFKNKFKAINILKIIKIIKMDIIIITIINNYMKINIFNLIVI